MALAQWPPKTWVIRGYRTGEAQQLHALATAIGSHEVKIPHYNWLNRGLALGRWVSARGLQKSSRSDFDAPWPELILSAGFQHEPLLRWIKRQSPTTQIAVIGRPWAPLHHFDLIITTRQYRLPTRPNVLTNDLTLHFAIPSERGQLESWARPYLAVLVGGPSGNYLFDERHARELVAQLGDWQAQRGGTVWVTTSRRTPPNAGQSLAKALQEKLPQQHVFYRWHPDDANNPYRKLLAIADAICVTADSVAMTSEALGTQKPVYLFDNACRKSWIHCRRLAEVKAVGYRRLTDFGPTRLGRDVDLFHDEWRRKHHLVALQSAGEQTPIPVTEEVVMSRTLSRLKQLFDA